MKDISGFEGLYKISEDGMIWSEPKDGCGGHSGKYLKYDKKPNGYLGVTLVKEKVNKRFLVHRLVAENFLDNQDNKPCVNHIDGVKTNNIVANLEWCTWAENEMHSRNVLGKAKPIHMVGRSGYLANRRKEVIQLSLEGIELNRFGSGSEAARNVGGIQSSISACCLGQRKTHKGFKWKYV